MTRTFLVALDLPDGSDLEAFSDEILDSLQTDSIPVLSVKPWSQPGASPASEFSGFTAPPIPPPSDTFTL